MRKGGGEKEGRVGEIEREEESKGRKGEESGEGGETERGRDRGMRERMRGGKRRACSKSR